MSERFPDATPRPWTVDHRTPAADLSARLVVPTENYGIDPAFDSVVMVRKADNAALIVYAVNMLDALEAVAEAALAYRRAEEACDISGEWEPAQEAAVVIDSALAALDQARKGQTGA